MDISSLDSKLRGLYGNSISIHYTTSNDVKIHLDLKDDCETAHYAVLIHNSKNIALIWDIGKRKSDGWTGQNVSFFKRWKEIFCSGRKIETFYKKFKANNVNYDEKLIILETDVLYELADCLPDLLKFDPNDHTCPVIIKKQLAKQGSTDVPRNRLTTSRWNRAQDFRQKVLSAYNYQCAICRCTEEKLLQAAHIIAVSQGGSDDTNNGICLCANHHLMLDQKLIDIDYKNLELFNISESVKDMPWYNAFVYNHKKKLLPPNGN